ncbi:bifunctional alpha/beta hydrolase/OsmC family protein [Pontibacter sp. E15-1]|uniref:bifunctional alpha/beta hydrolase/OsmC family protein n=1 Tax=Pontibacter sp. E15-1 TaxID=2919918 RepID=UPI001F4FA592|nr:bifunctional alpha/beta hydrolase/OsmC family protein [Pontibacter sp. E15-1]MCJ8163224.1 bifunctional alpha/beta hydrolase/OsmC family protein [Pontibacter sp. E15-1]
MQANKLYFKNSKGIQLSGHLDLPADQKPHNFVLFAHCFTCNKNFNAVRNVSRALTLRGFGVFQIDFTGLGASKGDFADSNFSGNVADLVAAAHFLEEAYQSPTLVIGHSLGGAAAIVAASQLDSVRAVATIGAPASPQHVAHLFQANLQEINQTGEALVNIGGRPFTIKKQFLDDLSEQTFPQMLRHLRKSLLVLHSPQDTVVGIENASMLFTQAHHPKSFVSLDGADHLLNREEDSLYAGDVIASWARRYLPARPVPELHSVHEVVALLQQDAAYTTTIKAGDHYLTADEPVAVQGKNFGPTPYQLVASGLAACSAMTVKMYAARKGWPLEDIEVHITYKKDHADDSIHEEDQSAKIDIFEREIKMTGPLDETQLQRLLEIADKCPVHKTLHSEVLVRTKLMKGQV